MTRFMLFVGFGLSLVASASCGEQPDTPLGEAAAANDAGRAARLLRSGADPNQHGRSGGTPLISAVRAGAVDVIRLLLDAGANPDRRDTRSTGWTPVMHAVHTRQLSALRLLLQRGADPNLGAGAGGLRPIMMAAADDDPAFVAALLERGADARYESAWGETPLSIAVFGGAFSDVDNALIGGCHPATARALLSHDPGLRLPRTAHARVAAVLGKLNRCPDVSELIK